MDSCENTVELVATDASFGQLECDGPSMTHHSRSSFDQPRSEAGQRPVSQLLGEFGPLQEDTQILGQCMKLQTDLVLRHPLHDNRVQLFACLHSLMYCSAVPRWL